MSSRTLPATRHSPFLLKSLKSLCSSSGTLFQGEDFTDIPDDESTLTFLIDLGYKGLLYKHPSMYVDHMHQPWRTLAAIINKFLSGKSASNDKLRKFRIDILWGMFYKENVNYPKLIWEDFAFQIDNMQLKKGRREIMHYPSHTIKDDGVVSRLKFVRIGEHFQEYRLPIPETMLTKKIKFTRQEAVSPKPTSDEESDEYDNIIPELDVALKLGKSMSLTKAAEEEAARQVHATHERIVTESNPEPARRRPSGITFRDNSGVSNKMSPNLSQKIKGVQILTPEKQLAADIMQALKDSRKTSISQSLTRGSSEGTGVSPRVPNKSTVIPTNSSEGTGTKPRVLNKEKVTSEAKADVILDWGSEQDSEYSEEDQGDDENILWESTDEDEEKKYDDDDADDDKSIDLEKTGDEETDNEFVHSEEYVQDYDEETDDELVHGDEQVNDDEDEEMTNAEDADTGNDDEEITHTTKANTKKIEKLKDDIKKSKLPPTSSSLFGSIDAEINSLLDIQIQQEIPHIPSPSVLTIPIFVIYEPLILSPITVMPSVTPATTLKPPSFVSTISHYPLPAISQRVFVLEKEVKEIKEVDHTTTLRALLRSKIPLAINAYLRSSLGDALQKVLHKHIKELKQQYSQKVDYKEIIKESVQANLINEVKNQLLKFLPKAVSEFATLVIQSTVKKSLEKTPLLGKKTKRSRTKESESSKKTSSTKETSRGKAPTKGSKAGKSATTEEMVEEPITEVVMDDAVNIAAKDVNNPKGDRCPFDLTKPLPLKGHPGRLPVATEYFFNNDMEFLKSLDPEKKYTTSITKTKAARYKIVGIEDMVPTLWSATKVGYDKDAEKGIKHWSDKCQLWYRSQINKFSKHKVYYTQNILSLVSVKVKRFHGYGHLDEIIVRRADRQLYKFKKGNLVDLHLNNIEDMLLLSVQQDILTRQQ
ncbi:hypothetical protein Tco_1549052 [Tanacetum coccineum]